VENQRPSLGGDRFNNTTKKDVSMPPKESRDPALLGTQIELVAAISHLLCGGLATDALGPVNQLEHLEEEVRESKEASNSEPRELDSLRALEAMAGSEGIRLLAYVFPGSPELAFGLDAVVRWRDLNDKQLTGGAQGHQSVADPLVAVSHAIENFVAEMKKRPTPFSNEIQDLLDRLVEMQGREQTLSAIPATDEVNAQNVPPHFRDLLGAPGAPNRAPPLPHQDGGSGQPIDAWSRPGTPSSRPRTPGR
jgi:hypothetical protein